MLTWSIINARSLEQSNMTRSRPLEHISISVWFTITDRSLEQSILTLSRLNLEHISISVRFTITDRPLEQSNLTLWRPLEHISVLVWFDNDPVFFYATWIIFGLPVALEHISLLV